MLVSVFKALNWDWDHGNKDMFTVFKALHITHIDFLLTASHIIDWAGSPLSSWQRRDFLPSRTSIAEPLHNASFGRQRLWLKDRVTP